MNSLKGSFKNVTKSITSLKIITWLRLLFGIYSKISDSKLISCLLRFYCLFINVVCIINYHVVFKIPLNSPGIFNSVQLISNCVFSLVTADGYFFKFCNAISTADTLMNYQKVDLVSNYVNIIIYLVLASRLCLCITFFVVIPNSLLVSPVIAIMFTSIHIYYVTVLIVFSLLHTRMRMLRIFLEGNPIPVNIIGRNEVANSIRNMRKGLFNYSYLLDNLRNINYQMQYLLITALAFSCPTIIHLMYLSFRACYLQMTFECITRLWENVEVLILITSPGIIAELVTSEVNKIMIILTKQLLQCSDESLRFELETALEYVRRRPFLFVIGGAVPLNSRLPLNMAALCVTYVILLVQFLHLH